MTDKNPLQLTLEEVCTGLDDIRDGNRDLTGRGRNILIAAEMIIRNCWDVTGDSQSKAIDLCVELGQLTGD
jgi:hypothetical protein